jgi:cell wall-associated NlpC family hydrolase
MVGMLVAAIGWLGRAPRSDIATSASPIAMSSQTALPIERTSTIHPTYPADTVYPTDTVLPTATGTHVPGLSCGEAVVSIAKQALGHPYKLGALEWNMFIGPENAGPTDCSAFTKWAYNRYAYLNRQLGFYIDMNMEHYESRTVLWQAENIGAVVDHDPLQDWKDYDSVQLDCSLLQEGDLIFFFNEAEKGLSHMGIYYGGCSMIHAGQSTNGVGIIDDLASYDAGGNHYIGAKRVCPNLADDKGGSRDGLEGRIRATPTP